GTGKGERGTGKGEGAAPKSGRANTATTAKERHDLSPFTAPRSQLPAEDVSSEIDLRGMTGDEAESVLLLALDSAVVDGLPWFRIIHGKGTGALRERVAQILKRDKRVATYQLAPPQQGGSGVTVVEFVS
ncbi:MAG: Smr/MutS family protein, partial [Gemmatimonadota bacterium]